MPIRLRLTIGFAIAMAAILVVLGGVAYFRFRSDLLDAVDMGLRSRAQVVVDALEMRSDSAVVDANGPLIDPDLVIGRRDVNLDLRLGRGRRDGCNTVPDDRAKRRWDWADRDAAPARSRQHEEVLAHALEVADVDACTVERVLQLSRLARSSQGEVNLGPERGERRSQLMAGVVDEPPFALERLLEPVEHRIQGRGQAGDFVPGCRDV